jgi:thiosulfate dehydrogenase
MLQQYPPNALYFIFHFAWNKEVLMKGFVAGLLVGILLLVGGAYYYFASGMAPAAATDRPMPFERMLARISLRAHINKADIPSPPIAANEENFLAGAKVYKDECAQCHGLPNQPSPTISSNMYPKAPLLFKGKGVTDDPPQESYWRATNGVRLTGMPSFEKALTDTQRWQVALLVNHANNLPDSVKKVLVPESAPAEAASATVAPQAKKPASKK